ncbi:restriction endonuclease [Desulfofustis glycolicus]|uniref:Restriction endonuclease n=1 Tax=Desulfofustis glycolicus DSM 9705 TaxID=1121409 RepID=A0A1M5XRD9_9BACT|nr:restriction endonuclease [Desulfofustis glycolicus]SHI02108.1 Restriction endonuclease [Desulfofustis glycolicus DSM 9705]
MQNVIEDLYNLTPQEFERLCAHLLVYYGYENIKLVGGVNDQGVDITCEKNGSSVVVQVKHLRKISFQTIQKVLKQILSSNYTFDEILLITSSSVNQVSRKRLIQSFPDLQLTILDYDEITSKLQEKNELEQEELKAARSRSRKQRSLFVIGFLGALSSILGSFISTYLFFAEPEKPLLNERIEKVELALGSLKNLENYLDDIKADMIQTEKETKAIEIEYQKAKELEKLTKEQYEVISKAIGRKSTYQTIFDYSMGLLLGVAGSLIASVIYTRIKQNRLLKE